MKTLRRKLFASTLLFLIIVTTAAMIWNVFQKHISQRIDDVHFPNEPLYYPNGERYTFDENIHEQYILLAFVNSDCDYCHKEIKQLSEGIDSINDIKVYLISSEPVNQLKSLKGLIATPRITLLFDKNDAFAKTLNVNYFPSTFLFDRNKNFKRQFKGSTTLNELISEIN